MNPVHWSENDLKPSHRFQDQTEPAHWSKLLGLIQTSLLVQSWVIIFLLVHSKTNLLIGPKINRRCWPAGAAPPLLRRGGGGAGEGGVAPVLRRYHAHLTGLWKREGKAGSHTRDGGRLVVRAVYRGFTYIIHRTNFLLWCTETSRFF